MGTTHEPNHEPRTRLEVLEHRVNCAEAECKELRSSLGQQDQLRQQLAHRVHKMDWMSCLVTIISGAVSGGAVAALF